LKFFFLFKKLNGSNLLGNRITFFSNLFKINFFEINKLNFMFQEPFLSNFFLDFLTFFRLQLPIRFLFKIKSIFRKYFSVNNHQNVHFFYIFEKITCLRGNDGSGILMLNIEKEKNFFKSYTKKIDRKLKFSIKSKEIFSKIFMRFSINNFFLTPFYQEIFDFMDFFFFEKFVFSSENKLTIQYTFETMFIFNYFQKESGRKIFFEKIWYLINQILNSGSNENLVFVFEIFSILKFDQNEPNFWIFYDYLFEGLDNPFLWGNPILLNSLIKFLNKFLKKKNEVLGENKVITVLTIWEKLIKNYGLIFEANRFFETVLIFLEDPKKFIPHIIEICFDQINQLPFWKFTILNVGLINLLIKKIPFESYEKKSNKVCRNFFSFLFYVIFSNKKEIITFTFFLENLKWVFNSLKNENRSLENFEGIFIRKAIMALKLNNFKKFKKNTKDIFRFSFLNLKKNFEIEDFETFRKKIYFFLKEYSTTNIHKINFQKITILKV